MRINKNKLAVRIVKKEGGKQSINIGQVKEVMKLYEGELKKKSASEILFMLGM